MASEYANQGVALVHRVIGSARPAQLLYCRQDGEPGLFAAEIAPGKQLIRTLGCKGARRFAVVSQQCVGGTICVLGWYHGPIPVVR